MAPVHGEPERAPGDERRGVEARETPGAEDREHLPAHEVDDEQVADDLEQVPVPWRKP